MKNFNDTYNYNRVPFGLYLHYFWFYNNDVSINMARISFVKRVLYEMSTYPNVVFATSQEIIDWVKNPIAFNEMTSWTCKNQAVDIDFPCIDYSP